MSEKLLSALHEVWKEDGEGLVNDNVMSSRDVDPMVSVNKNKNNKDGSGYLQWLFIFDDDVSFDEAVRCVISRMISLRGLDEEL